jgi:hypothetical protein
LKAGQLYPNRTFVDGELQAVTWHPDSDFMQDPWIEVSIDYTRDAAEFALSRITTRRWKLDDGSWGPAVTKTKLYYVEPASMYAEGVRRRTNVYNYAITITFGYLSATAPIYQGVTDGNAIKQLGQDFLKRYQDNFVAFRDFSRDNILDDILNDTESAWLNNVIDADGTTIRTLVHGIFNIWDTVLT